MKRFEGLTSVNRPFKHTAITMGNFDGVHIGHRKIIKATIGLAKKMEGTSLIYTFYPHPVKLLAPESCPPLIQSIDQRLEEFEKLGIDACVVEPFSFNLAHLEPKDFFNKVLRDKFGAEAVVVGYDFTFGLHRRGTVELLEQLGLQHGIDVMTVPAQFHGELLISSTEIRRDVQSGAVDRAKELMEAPFTLRGTVVRGKGIGESLGAHTANIDVENELLPKDGVYITYTRLVGEPFIRPSITSVGVNPTFKDSPYTVETHIIDFDGNLVKKKIDVQFHQWVRGQIAFDSPETLKGQIERDIQAARKWHEEHSL